MNIYQCQEIAKHMKSKVTFDLVGPRGRTKVKWLDVDLGLIQIEGESGFIRAKDLMWAVDITCENLEEVKE